MRVCKAANALGRRHVRRRWKRLSRALRGNTMPEAEGTRLAWWNARQWAGNGVKWVWLKERLKAEAIDVMVILEVATNVPQTIALRDRAKRAGYELRRLPGELAGCVGGIVVLIRKGTTRWSGKAERLEAKVFAVKVRCLKLNKELNIAAIHGDETHGLAQVAAIRRWARNIGPATVVGDWNAVPCKAWQRSGATLSPFDRSVRRLAEFSCDCCDEIEDDAPMHGRVVADRGRNRHPTWTRFETCKGCWGEPTSRIDYAVELGGGLGWSLEEGIPAELLRDDKDAKSATIALSDHLLQSMWLPSTAMQTREQRPTGIREGRAGQALKVRRALDGLLAEEGLGFDLSESAWEGQRAGVSATRPVAKELVRIGKQAEKSVADERQGIAAARLRAGGGFNSAKQRFHDWTAVIQVVLRSRALGLQAEEIRGGPLYHHKRGLRLLLREGWPAVLARCRAEASRASRQLKAISDGDNNKRVAEAKELLKIPAEDAEGRQRAAYKMIYRERGSVVMDGMHEKDDPDAPFVHCTSDTFDRVSRMVGELFVDKLDKGCAPLCFQAWLDVFVGKFDDVKGLDGLAWDLRKELSFTVFEEVVESMPVKAVGAGGFSISLLKRAPTDVRKVVWRAMVGDASRATFDPDWRRVMYALLVKPLPNRADVVSQRREIALMAIEMKLLLQCVRRTCYSRMAGRIHSSAMGWLATYGCTDLGICAAHVTDQARLLGHELYLLYVDLATFFPKIQRGPLRAAKLAHGLPRVVVDLAGLIYGRHKGDPACVTCHYDSAAGLGGGFANHMGSLMGCVLSTEDARIFLNSLITAIFAVARGVRLWGYAEADVEATWAELCQLVLADDWLGCFTRVKEVRRAWAMLSTWEPCSGAEIGIKAAAKTVLSGVRWGSDGKPKPIGFLKLCTADGRTVPIIGAHEAYKHLGRLRRADGSCFSERQAFFKKVRHAVSLIRGMRKPSRFALMLVSDALIVGLAGFYLQTLHITWAEAEKLEALWRSAANRALGRKRDTPRLEFYLPGAGRTHLFAVNLSAKMGAGCRAMGDLEGTPQRGAARSALALAAARWGCCGDLAEWKFGHITDELERAMGHAHHRTFGEGWLLAWALCERSVLGDEFEQEELEDYMSAQPRFIMYDGDVALSSKAPHFKPPRTTALFESSGDGGLNLPVRAALVNAGVLGVGQLCQRRVDGVVELMSARAAMDQGVRLRTSADKVAWDETVALVERVYVRGGAALEVEQRRDIKRFWRDGEASKAGVDLKAIERLKTSIASEANLEKRGLHPKLDGTAMRASKEWWTKRLREAITDVPAPSTVEWKHGLNGADLRASGPRIVRVELDGTRRCSSGGEQWWLRQGPGDSVGADGWYADWRERELELRDMLDVDFEGYVCRSDGSRYTKEECSELPPLIQLHARARLATSKLPLTAGPAIKATASRVNIDLAAAAVWDACTWQARLRITEAFTLDGGKVEVRYGEDDKYQVQVVAYAAIRHDGVIFGGVVSDSKMDAFVRDLDLPGTSYLAELAAQVRAAKEAKDGGRVFVFYDAQSPEAAVNAYRRSHARRAREKLARGWLSEVCVQERRLQLKAYGWQTSHVGAPHNEWVDAEVANQAESWQESVRGISVRGLHATYRDATTVRFPRARTSMLQWAKPRADKLVCDRLRLSVKNTIFREPDDAKLGRLTDGEELALHAVAARRWALADEGGGGRPEDRAHRGALACPAGCSARCDSYHFVYECLDCELSLDRELLTGKLQEFSTLVHVKGGLAVQADVTAACHVLTINAKLKFTHGVVDGGEVHILRKILKEAEGDDCPKHKRRPRDELTRIMAGHYECGKGGKELRAAATSLAKLTARMLERGKQLTAKLSAEAAAREKAQSKFRKYAARLAALVDAAGTRRAARLRQVDQANNQVHGWQARVAGGLPMDLLDAWVPVRRRIKAEAREVRLPEGEEWLHSCTAWLQWWATARVLGWRLRARHSSNVLAWLQGLASAHARLGTLVASFVEPAHGDSVRGRRMQVLKMLSARGRRNLPAIVELEREEAVEEREGWEVKQWADDLTGQQLEWVTRWDAGVVEGELRARAVSAGRRERRLRRAGRKQLQLVPPRATRLDAWQQQAEGSAGAGVVRRPVGSWDLPVVASSRRVARRVEGRLRKRDRFRAAKGEEEDRDGTWGFETILRTRVALPARTVEGESVIEALVLWRGDWDEEQTKWVALTAAMFPGADGKRQRTAELRLFHAEHPEHRAARLEQKAAAEGGGGGRRAVRRGGDGERAGEDSSEESWAGSAGSSDEGEEEDQRPYAVALRKLGRASRRAVNARARADRAFRVVEAGKKARAMERGAERARRYLRRQARAVRRAARREEMSAWLLSTIQLRHEEHKRKRVEAELLASNGAQWKRLRRTQRQD